MNDISDAACAVADEWERMSQSGQRMGRITGTRKLCDSLSALELATRNSPLRKILPPKLCLRCADDGNDVPATDGDYCAACHDSLGELQDERNAR
jgi:hypothetical protein